jgi:hypothetical protein
MTGHRHATDRKDWTIIAECSDDPDHVAIEAAATNVDGGAKQWIPIETCPGCGADMAIITDERPTEVLD